MKKALYFVMILLISVSVFGADKKEKSSEEYLKDLNASKSEKIIIEAADWAGKEKESDAIKKLIALLDDSRVKVRLHSAMALGYIGKEDGADSLNKLLLNDSNSDVRYAALLATVTIGSKKSIETWKKAKEQESDPFIKDFLEKMEERFKKK